MLINSEKLIGLRAETQSGVPLGRVISVDIDIDTQGLRAYHIKPALLEGGLFKESLQVHHKQIVSITEEKMVVIDNVVKYKEEKKKKVFVGTQAEI